MPARSRKSSRWVQHKQKKKGRFQKKNFFLLFVFLLVAGVLIFLFFKPKLWDTKTRLSLVINSRGEDLVLVNFDPETNSITRFLIPKNTEVEAAHNLGTWKLGSVWQLGMNEKLGGKLLSETITKSFKFPTEAWAEEKALGFAEPSLGKVLQATFSWYQTNLSFRDRINLLFFCLKVKTTGRSEILLTESGYLYSARLADGEMGYRLKKTPPAKLMANFAVAAISKESLVVSIIDATGDKTTASRVGEIIEALGAKVIAMSPVVEEEVGCLVSGPASLTLEKIATIFSCQTKKISQPGIEIKIGSEFGQRF